jgi:hypothetical protein
MMGRGTSDPRQKRAAYSAVALAVLASCLVRLAPDYDPVLDRSAADVAVRVDAFLTRMEAVAGTPEGTYAKNREFYGEVKATLRTLRLRAEAAPKAEKIVKSLDLVLDNVEELRGLHEEQGDAGLRRAEVDPSRTAFASQFRQLFTYEAALRRGE